MIIKSVILKNYRKFDNLEVKIDNNKLVVVSGENKLGKTTLIESVYWAFTGNLLENENNINKIKNEKHSREVVSVKVLFEIDNQEHEIERQYFEKLIKPRGSYQEIMIGNQTNIIVDGIVTKTNQEGINMINDILGLRNAPLVSKKINVMNMLMNPSYLLNQDKKDIRYMVMGLLKSLPETEEEIENKTLKQKVNVTYLKFKGDYALMGLFYKQSIESLKLSIEKTNSVIDFIDNDKHASYDDKLKAEEEITNNTNLIKEISNKYIDLQEKVSVIRKQCNDDFLLEQKAFIQKQQDYLKVKREKEVEIDSIKRKIFNISNNQTYINDTKQSLEEVEKSLDNLNKEYEYLISDKYLNDNAKECPNCHFKLNVAEVENMREKEIESNKRRIMLTKNQIDKLKSTIRNININDNIEELKESLKKLEEDYRQYLNDNINLSGDFKPSIALLVEKENYNQSLNKLNDYRQKKLTNDNEKVEELKNRNIKIQAIISDYELSLKNEEKKNLLLKDIDTFNKKIIKNEQLQEICKTLMINEIKAYEKKLSIIFKDLKIKLVENNIKENSFKTTFQVYILGKDNTYESGSTSEQLVTSLYLVERLKDYLKLPNLPYIVDKGECLDKESLNKLDEMTQSQILITQVKDTKLEIKGGQLVC